MIMAILLCGNITKNQMEYKFVALTVGPGAGSKFLHTLLDDHPEMYSIPGYCMYISTITMMKLRSRQSLRDLIAILLDLFMTQE